MKVLELKGYKALRAMNVFHGLLLGLKMMPKYYLEEYETFHARFADLDDDAKEKLIREAALFVELKKEDVEALACFVCDPNGAPYQAANIKNLGPGEILDIIVAVCMEIGRIKINLVSEEEKKK